MTEAALQAAVIDLARLLGWRVAAFRPARTEAGWRTPVQGDGKGWPDLVLVHRTRGVIFRELKVGRGRLTPEQEIWRDSLCAAGQDWGVWRDADWPEAIRADLENRGRTSERDR